MQCPRCQTEITVLPDPGGSIVCPGCGARLMTRAHARAAASPSPSASDPGLASQAASATLPGATHLRRLKQLGEDAAGKRRRVADASSDTPVSGMPAADRHPPERAATDGGASLEDVMGELRLIREAQAQILSILLGGSGEAGSSTTEVSGAEAERLLAPARTRRR